jgi:hypothetical protein
MAWLPDREIYGPERPTVRDVDPLNRVFYEAFTDRYRRDGMTGVRVPYLNPAIWRYALEDAGEGAMVWRDPDGELWLQHGPPLRARGVDGAAGGTARPAELRLERR